MTKAAQQVLEAALKLSAEEQDELILLLLGMHEEEKTNEEILTDQWKAELMRRAAFLDANPDAGVSPAEAVRLAAEMVKKKAVK